MKKVTIITFALIGIFASPAALALEKNTTRGPTSLVGGADARGFVCPKAVKQDYAAKGDASSTDWSSLRARKGDASSNVAR